MIGAVLAFLLPSLTVQSILLYLIAYFCIYLVYNKYLQLTNKNECPNIGSAWFFYFIRSVVDDSLMTPHEWFHAQNKKLGPLICGKIGAMKSYTIGDFALMKQAFVQMGEVFSGRMREMIGIIDEENERKSLLVAEGPLWKEHRRFTLSALRNFGIGKASIEPAILNEISYFLTAIERHNGEPFNISKVMAMSTSNVIAILEFGKRFDYDDADFAKLRHCIEENLSNQKAAMIVFFPFLKYIPGLERYIGLDYMKRNYDYYMAFFQREIDEHKKNYKPGVKSDYIDAYLEEMENRVRTNNQPEIFDYETLKQNLYLFYFAGSETTSSTLIWGLIYMMVHPDIQRKVQKEIDDVIGRERTPSYDDKLRMPYTDATIMEVERKSCVVSTNVPRRTLDDVNLNGYNIPKGSVITSSIWSAHHDEKLYPDPYTFRPERFINEEGKAVRPEHLIPFSLGKRFCIGEPLARMELFLYFTSMLQKFTFSVPEGETVSTHRTKLFVGGVPDHKMCAVPRT